MRHVLLVAPFFVCALFACSTSSSGGDSNDTGTAGTNGASGSTAGGSTGGGGTSAAGGTSSGGSSAGGAAAAGAPAGGTTGGGGTSAAGAGGSTGTAGMVGTGGTTGSFTEAPDGPMKGIVAEHNKARASVSPPAATPLPEMSWDTKVAADAQAWADGCMFEHDPKLNALKQGQNIYASSGSTPTPQKVVSSWVSEVSDYDYASNKCAAGKACGHYTQVVWAKSTGLGCAQKTCTANSPFGSGGKWDLWVCNYSPPGNYSGQKPY